MNEVRVTWAQVQDTVVRLLLSHGVLFSPTAEPGVSSRPSPARRGAVEVRIQYPADLVVDLVKEGAVQGFYGEVARANVLGRGRVLPTPLSPDYAFTILPPVTLRIDYQPATMSFVETLRKAIEENDFTALSRVPAAMYDAEGIPRPPTKRRRKS